MSVCNFECDSGIWQAVARKRHKVKSKHVYFPFGLTNNNRFDNFSEMVDVGGLEVLKPEEVLGRVGMTERLRFAGEGKVTISSGAAETVIGAGNPSSRKRKFCRLTHNNISLDIPDGRVYS